MPQTSGLSQLLFLISSLICFSFNLFCNTHDGRHLQFHSHRHSHHRDLRGSLPVLGVLQLFYVLHILCVRGQLRDELYVGVLDLFVHYDTFLHLKVKDCRINLLKFTSVEPFTKYRVDIN